MTQQFTPLLPAGMEQEAQSESALHEVGQVPPPLPPLPPVLPAAAPDDDGALPVAAGAALIAPPDEAAAPWPAALVVVPRNPASLGGYP
jgi:hypothetical protein